MGSAGERWHHFVTSSLIGWTPTQNDPCKSPLVRVRAWWHGLISFQSANVFWSLLCDICVGPPISLESNYNSAEIIVSMSSAGERWHHFVMSSLIGWAPTQNDPCKSPLVQVRAWWHGLISFQSANVFWSLLCDICVGPPISLESNYNSAEIIVSMSSAGERWHHFVMSSLIGWAPTQNDPCKSPLVQVRVWWHGLISFQSANVFWSLLCDICASTEHNWG